MRGRDISIAGYLYEHLDKQRIVDEDTKEKESWTMFFCRTYNVKYRPHGIKKKPGRPRGSSA
ncbi:MAG: hypothetical protein A2W25_04150 [candidate division Zixibacteria bacterium RBG_16_53_22]|nr:MAG: hypothetical protein A2W25_04150 [candidate division Zixibacteria bacterium RBG_16_53_22]